MSFFFNYGGVGGISNELVFMMGNLIAPFLDQSIFGPTALYLAQPTDQNKFSSNDSLEDEIDQNASRKLDSYVPIGKYEQNYIRIADIGSGSYGKVFKVKKRSNEESFAVKIIPIKDEEKELKELITSLYLVELNSPNLVKFYDVWHESDFVTINGATIKDSNSSIYIQMELCKKNLENFLKGIEKDSTLKNYGLLTSQGFYLMSEIFIQILEGVTFLHQRNIIHRDLKPDNILLNDDNDGNYVKISDIGLAKVFEEARFDTKDKGTSKYMAPEVLNGKRYNLKADIYSLGVIMEKMFDIDFSQTYENDIKNKNIRQQIENMTQRDYNMRPDCEKLYESGLPIKLTINLRNSWYSFMSTTMRTHLSIQ